MCDSRTFPAVFGGELGDTIVNCVVFPNRNAYEIWMFGKTFESYFTLRSEIESLPFIVKYSSDTGIQLNTIFHQTPFNSLFSFDLCASESNTVQSGNVAFAQKSLPYAFIRGANVDKGIVLKDSNGSTDSLRNFIFLVLHNSVRIDHI